MLLSAAPPKHPVGVEVAAVLSKLSLLPSSSDRSYTAGTESAPEWMMVGLDSGPAMVGCPGASHCPYLSGYQSSLQWGAAAVAAGDPTQSGVVCPAGEGRIHSHRSYQTNRGQLGGILCQPISGYRYSAPAKVGYPVVPEGYLGDCSPWLTTTFVPPPGPFSLSPCPNSDGI